MNRERYLYAYRDPKTGVVRYVGQAIRLARAMGHLNHSSNVRTHRMIKKRQAEGYALQPEIFPMGSISLGEINEAEELLVSMFGREDIGTGSLFNNTGGGDGTRGRIKSADEIERHRSKMKQVQWSDETNARRRASHLGKKASEEAKRNQSLAHMGVPWSPTRRARFEAKRLSKQNGELQ